MSRANLASEVNAAAMKLSPPVAVAAAQVGGWGPQDWMYALTALYVVLQAFYLIWKWWREAHKPDDESDSE
jgi:uncharacterized membrane protein YfcA